MRAGVTKERLVEAKEINKSLTALGDVISALSSGKRTQNVQFSFLLLLLLYEITLFFLITANLFPIHTTSAGKFSTQRITCFFARTGESFIPYRNHKLTQVMSDSLGGTAKTLMFVNISPADYNTDETVTSLMYASRVKLITNEVREIAPFKIFFIPS